MNREKWRKRESERKRQRKQEKQYKIPKIVGCIESNRQKENVFLGESWSQ